MWHKAEWMGRPMRLELTRVGLLVKLVNRYTTNGAHKALQLTVGLIRLAFTEDSLFLIKYFLLSLAY